MFVSYWFIIFICIFFPIFWMVQIPSFRKIWLLIASVTFHYKFAGPAGVIPIVFLGIFTYIVGLSQVRLLRILAILSSVLALIFYKYTTFLLSEMLSFFDANFAASVLKNAQEKLLPQAPPLAISFFVFEFVHYLIDVERGKKPIRSVADFTLFSIFWPSVVSGPVKRYDQFLPGIARGCKNISLLDIQTGIVRITTGLIKKLVIADNLTAYLAIAQPRFQEYGLGDRWLIMVAISFRILCDFSGYSDIAIGFARLMGIKLPENFRWPYLATNIQAFWHRWHISLSTWIRDYIYIPLGGNKLGPTRKLINGIIAFAICGLWHGAALNFIFWGMYHGVGLAVHNQFFRNSRQSITFIPFAWLFTFLFVSIGWLYFFYPIKEATTMLLLLFTF